MSDIQALAASYGSTISQAGVIFIERLQNTFPERTILWKECHEWTKGLEKTKVGLRVFAIEEGWTPYDTWVTIQQPTLAFKLRRRVSRVPIKYEWVKRSIKDPTWLEDVRRFSSEHRRGTEFHLSNGILRIVDVTRTGGGGRQGGFNDSYLVRFDPCA